MAPPGTLAWRGAALYDGWVCRRSGAAAASLPRRGRVAATTRARVKTWRDLVRRRQLCWVGLQERRPRGRGAAAATRPHVVATLQRPGGLMW